MSIFDVLHRLIDIYNLNLKKSIKLNIYFLVCVSNIKCPNKLKIPSSTTLRL